MRYIKRIKARLPEIIFVALIIVFCYLYFVIYMTPSRVAWYREMRKQMLIFLKGVTGL